MNDSPLVGAHRLKCKSHSRLPHAIRRKIRHSLQFGFASGAEAVHVTNQSCAASQTSAENLIEQVLQRFEQFASLCLKQLRVLTFDIQHFAGNALLHTDPQLQTCHFKDVLE